MKGQGIQESMVSRRVTKAQRCMIQVPSFDRTNDQTK